MHVLAGKTAGRSCLEGFTLRRNNWSFGCLHFFSRSVFPVTSNSHQNTPQQYAIGAFKSTILCFKRTTFSYSSYVCCHIRFKDVCRDRSFNSNFTVPQDQHVRHPLVFLKPHGVFSMLSRQQRWPLALLRGNCQIPHVTDTGQQGTAVFLVLVLSLESRPGMKTIKTIQLFEFCAGIYSTHAHILSRNGISLILYTRQAMP